MKRLLIVFAGAVLLGACTVTPSVTTPAGFARFPGDERALAVSPEGVGFEVRVTENDPVQDIAFWSEALERHMLDSGYLPYEQSRFASRVGDGQAFEWLAPVGADDWVYLTAIVVAGDSVIIAEAAGPYDYYREHRDAILDAIETIGL